MASLKKKILSKILKKMAELVLSRQEARVVGITGSVGKSTAKEMTSLLLEDFFSVRKNEKNFNTEIGVPLAICGSLPPESIFGWPKVFWKGLKNIIFRKNYPEILVLELGADKKGDIKYLSELTRPIVGVLTSVGISHLEHFKTVKNLAKEKGELFLSLPVGGWAVYNFDDSECRNIAQKIKAETISYGFSEGAVVRATDVFMLYQDSGVEREYFQKVPCGMGFKINYRGKILPIRLNGSFGLPVVYGALAAFSVGLYFQLNPIKMANALQKKMTLEKRLNFKEGIKNSWLIDDCYNSAPLSLNVALDVLAEIRARRRIAVLGDMLELGIEEEPSHRKIGERLANEKVDFFLAVGDRMKWALEEYGKNKGLEEKENSSAWFASSEEAGKVLQALIRPDDLILVKGSRGMEMEKIVQELEFKEGAKS